MYDSVCQTPRAKRKPGQPASRIHSHGRIKYIGKELQATEWTAIIKTFTKSYGASSSRGTVRC